MPQWAAFLTVVVLLTLLLLALARQSQRLIHEQVDTRAVLESGETDPLDRPVEAETVTAADAETATPAGAEFDVPGDAETATRVGTGVDTPTDAETATQAGAGVDASGDAETATRVDDVELTTPALLLNLATTQGVVAAIVLVAGWFLGIPADAFGVTADSVAALGAAAAIGAGFGLVLWMGNELSTRLADAVGATYDETVRGMLAPETATGWGGLLLVVLPVIAVAEELLFRAALIGVPAAGFDVSPWLLAVVSSLAFALGHGAQGRLGVVVTGVLGLALAAGYILTGSLFVVVVAHYVVNATEFLVYEYVGTDEPVDALARRLSG